MATFTCCGRELQKFDPLLCEVIPKPASGSQDEFSYELFPVFFSCMLSLIALFEEKWGLKGTAEGCIWECQFASEQPFYSCCENAAKGQRGDSTEASSMHIPAVSIWLLLVCSEGGFSVLPRMLVLTSFHSTRLMCIRQKLFSNPTRNRHSAQEMLGIAAYHPSLQQRRRGLLYFEVFSPRYALCAGRRGGGASV